MGMFDYVQCEVPLPNGFAGELQTKDFDCLLTTVLIRADGRLLVQDRVFEAVALNERPFPDDPRKRLIGARRLVSSCWRDLDFHGDFDFYGSDEDGEFHSYRARFTHGQLEWIRQLTADGNLPTKTEGEG